MDVHVAATDPPPEWRWLLVHGDGNDDPAWWVGHLRGEYWTSDDGNGCPRTAVTHWCELPETPPREPETP